MEQQASSPRSILAAARRESMARRIVFAGVIAMALFCLMLWTQPSSLEQFARGVAGMVVVGAALFLAYRLFVVHRR